MSAQALLADATARLEAAGVDSPRTDAELLLAAVLGTTRTRLLTLDTVAASAAAEYERAVARRVAREPLQHITGTAPFRRIEVPVGPGVFVPRPETELLVDAVLPHLRTIERPAVVDLCSGSGALALALADELPTAGVVAVESSAPAVRWLSRNVAGAAAATAAGTRVKVVAADVRDPEALRGLYGQADAVVANPPYVPRPADVAPEVLADPREAVFAGPDGLDLLPVIVTRAALLLRPGGVLAVEHDDSHGDAVPALLTDDGRFAEIAAHRDLAGRSRFATAVRA